MIERGRHTQADKAEESAIIGNHADFFHPEERSVRLSVREIVASYTLGLPPLSAAYVIGRYAPHNDILPIAKDNVLHHLRDHSAHVFALCDRYMHKLNTLGAQFSREDIEAVRLAAIFHDAERINDVEDPFHGERVAVRIENDLGGLFGIPGHLRPTVCTIIREHVPEDDTLPHMHSLTRIFKDIDNMLWLRTGDLDTSYLRHPAAHDLLPIAEALIHETRNTLGPGQDGFVVAINAAVSIGLIDP